MQPTDKLLTHTTNRLPLLPLPIHYSTHQQSPANQSKIFMSMHISKSLMLLAQREELLERDIEQAKAEHQIMLELFQNMYKIQRGQAKQTKKLQRRCNKDILDKMECTYAGCNRFYSSEATLQRHVKLKHRIVKEQPPQLYHDLHPQPNLTTQVESQDSQSLPDFTPEEEQHQS